MWKIIYLFLNFLNTIYWSKLIPSNLTRLIEWYHIIPCKSMTIYFFLEIIVEIMISIVSLFFTHHITVKLQICFAGKQWKHGKFRMKPSSSISCNIYQTSKIHCESRIETKQNSSFGLPAMCGLDIFRFIYTKMWSTSNKKAEAQIWFCPYAHIQLNGREQTNGLEESTFNGTVFSVHWKKLCYVQTWHQPRR